MGGSGESTVVVTGGSGFVGSHLVRRLLERDYRVRTTVRSTAKTAKVRPLWEMQEAFPGRLDLFEADLLTEGSFDEAVSGCAAVFHVASPFLMPEKIKDGRRDMVDPALLGTRNVLASVERTPTVQRLVFTSTVGAIFGDYIDVLSMDDHVLSETYVAVFGGFTPTIAAHPSSRPAHRTHRRTTAGGHPAQRDRPGNRRPQLRHPLTGSSAQVRPVTAGPRPS